MFFMTQCVTLKNTTEYWVKILLLEEVCMNNGNIPLSCDKRRHLPSCLTKRKMNAQYFFSVCEKPAAQTSVGWVSTVSTARGNGEATVGGFYMKYFLGIDHKCERSELRPFYIVWKLLKMSHLDFGIFHQFLSYWPVW